MLDNIANHPDSTQTGSLALPARHNVPPLPHSVQEHLGQMLRADYYERGEKPRYLGDSALPVEFDPYLYRLEQKERASGSCGLGDWVRRLLPMHSQVSISKAHPRGAEAVFLMTGTSRKVQIQRAFNVHGPERLILRSPPASLPRLSWNSTRRWIFRRA